MQRVKDSACVVSVLACLTSSYKKRPENRVKSQNSRNEEREKDKDRDRNEDG